MEFEHARGRISAGDAAAVGTLVVLRTLFLMNMFWVDHTACLDL